MRIVVTGIPSHWERALRPSGPLEPPRYREIWPPTQTWSDIQRELLAIKNTGNYLIGEGVRNLFHEHDLEYVPWYNLVGPDSLHWLQYVNVNCDAVVFAAANIFNSVFDTRQEAHVFGRLTPTVLILSAGVQHAHEFGKAYPPAFEPLMKALLAPNIHVFARGQYTKEFLGRHGVLQTTAVGCPSMYFRPKNIRRALEEFKRIDLRGRLDINHTGYLGRDQSSIVDSEAIGGNGRAWYTLQDEPLICGLKPADENVLEYDDVTGSVSGCFSYLSQFHLRKKLDCRIFFNSEIWRSELSKADLSIGQRFHGNVAAGQAGVPFLIESIDSRIQEMVELAGFPHVNAQRWRSAPDRLELLCQVQSEFDVQRALQAYAAAQMTLLAALAELGITVSAQGL